MPEPPAGHRKASEETSRCRGQGHRATSFMTAPTVQRDRAGGAHQDLIEEYS
jgi:hypothetical protein